MCTYEDQELRILQLQNNKKEERQWLVNIYASISKQMKALEDLGYDLG